MQGDGSNGEMDRLKTAYIANGSYYVLVFAEVNCTIHSIGQHGRHKKGEGKGDIERERERGRRAPPCFACARFSPFLFPF